MLPQIQQFLVFPGEVNKNQLVLLDNVKIDDGNTTKMTMEIVMWVKVCRVAMWIDCSDATSRI